MYEIATKIDIYTDFTVYNQIRLELEREIYKKLQVAERLQKMENLLPMCRVFFANQQVQLIGSFSQTNLMKLEILHNPGPQCENVEVQKIFITPTSSTARPENYDTEILKVLAKYRTRPWGKKTYRDFDDKIWNLFLAINSEEQQFKKNALAAFKKYDEDRAILDKALAHRIAEFEKQIPNEKNPCRVDLIRLKKELGRAMFDTTQKKHNSLVATNYVRTCLNNQRKIFFAMNDLTL
ncbi:GD20850 [Drosophila simulans]|uniref:GD20850 n=2 Tax=Drosophila simulans TaxID=7240 RepID=B4QXZ4_DROSI|nr:GD20850 [Drosophila simulans]